MHEQRIHDLRFELAYSHCLEMMVAVLNRRIEKILLLIQFILGSAVVTEHGSGLLLGILIVLTAALLFVLKPGEVSGNARQQAQKYRVLLDELSSTDAEVIMKKRHATEESDNPVPYALNNPAYLRAAFMLGIKIDEKIKLTFTERALAFLCGGIPR